ncbi:MAG TPA: hypothetical protein DCQ51_09460 [Planktothrix sp. UBA8407]|nr:hypothetical protein [Planktothrix sp. UBA8402]HAO11377.1 hypothetical protein [Planktothrix sp. UBA8407]HBK22084.1 hypothetical protein [Planktothrix sp. UBA10369]
MIHKSNSFTLFYPQNQAFIFGESHLPECLMIVDGAYRAFQMPLSWLLGIIFIPLILVPGFFIELEKAINIWGLPQIARLIRFTGSAIGGLAALNLLSVFFNPVLFKLIERLWAKRRASYIIQHGGEVVDAWVFSVKEDSDRDWRIEFKMSQDSYAEVYGIIVPSLPDHLSNLEHGSILKVLRYKNYLYIL